MVSGSRKLIIVEDEPLVAGLLRDSLIEHGFTIKVAHSASEARDALRDFDPDLALIDINLGRGVNGVDLAFILSTQYPGIAILLLTHHPDLRTAGFDLADLPPRCGFLRKSEVTSTRDILRAVEELVQDATSMRENSDHTSPFSQLTDTQIEVLRMVSQGCTNAEIARRRQTSIRAVERMLTSIFSALAINELPEINPRVEAARMFNAIAGTPSRIQN